MLIIPRIQIAHASSLKDPPPNYAFSLDINVTRANFTAPGRPEKLSFDSVSRI